MDQDPYSNEKVLLWLNQAQEIFTSTQDYPAEQIAAFLVEFCKIFKAMAKLLEFAFSDVIEKAQVIRDRYNEYKEHAKGIFAVIQIEIKQGIIELNGENNKKIMGNKSYANYQSMGRTILRIMRFLNYLKIMFSEIDLNRTAKISDCCSKAYMEALYPYHTFMVQTAAKAAMMACPNRVRVLEIFVGPNKTDDFAYQQIKAFIAVLEPVRLNLWDYYGRHKLSNLP